MPWSYVQMKLDDEYAPDYLQFPAIPNCNIHVHQSIFSLTFSITCLRLMTLTDTINESTRENDREQDEVYPTFQYQK